MSYRYSKIDRLMSLYLSHRASKSEIQELEEWANTSAANREVFERLKEIWSMSSNDEYHSNMDRVRDKIWADGTGEPQVVKAPVQAIDVFYWSKVAATFTLLFTCAWLFASLVKENTILLPESESVAVVERVNPIGQRSTHRLPDGTRVWLNSSSSLIYPEKFSDTLRLVRLRGEAFFEVAKDQQKPFIVEAAGIRTQALGTAFNVHAYPEDLISKVSLLEGKVLIQDVSQFQSAVLSPGEELLIPQDNADFIRQQFNYEYTFGWKEGILLFDGADFAKFRSAIEKWYGVEVEVKGKVPVDWNIRARYQQENLKHVLRDICFNKNIKFELHDKKVTLIF